MVQETQSIVAEAFCGTRADAYLAENIDGLTRNAAQRILLEGRAVRGNAPLRKNDRLKAGDVVVCDIPPPATYEVTAEDIPLDIIFEDADIVVVNKPRGMVVHPAAGHYGGTLVNALLYHLGPSLSGIGGVMRPGIVHRLDKDTSGLLVVAKNDAAHQALATQLSSREMGRIYQALCIGRVKQDEMRIDIPIGRHSTDRKKMAAITTLRQGGKSREAATNVMVLERMHRFTLVEARLETGRTHQIRVHLAHVGYPVLGDALYGPKKQPLGMEGQVLHAKGLRLCHPSTGEVMEFEVALPGYFCEALARVRGVR